MQNGAPIRDHYDVFISYRHATGFYMAEVIYTRLVYTGYSVFMDKTMDSGRFEEKIHDAIQKSKNFVLVLFPGDLDRFDDPSDWLRKETEWALSVSDLNIIPVMCDGFEWPTEASSESLQKLKRNNGIPMHRDYSLDQDLDKLCDRFLKNTNPTRHAADTDDFFESNLAPQKGLRPTHVDMAFHAGAAWLFSGKKKDILDGILAAGIPTRILINTAEAAESIARHMRDADAPYLSFEQAHVYWRRRMEKYEGLLEVRACEIPLIHVYHKIGFLRDEKQTSFAKIHIKYYAYNNIRLDRAFEHELTSFSEYFSIYNDEFEFLWNQSRPIADGKKGQ